MPVLSATPGAVQLSGPPDEGLYNSVPSGSVGPVNVPTNFVRGLRSSLIQHDIGNAAWEAQQAEQRGDAATAQQMRRRAGELADEDAQAPVSVGRVEDIHGPTDALKWGAGLAGGLPAALVSPAAGSVAGAAAGAALQARFPGLRSLSSLGGYLGGTAGMYGDTTNAAAAQQVLAEESGKAPRMDAGDAMSSERAQGLGQAALYNLGALPAVRAIINPTVGAAASGAGQLVRGNVRQAGREALDALAGTEKISPVTTLAKDTALNVGTMYGAEKVGQHFATGRNPNRDTSEDDSAALNAMATGGALGLGFGGAHLAANTLMGAPRVAVGAVGDIAGKAKDQGGIAGTLGGLYGKAIAKADDAAQRLNTYLTDPMRGDEDATTLTRPQDHITDNMELAADDAAKHEAAGSLAQRIVAGQVGGVPDSVRTAAEAYMAGDKRLDSWGPFADAIDTWRTTRQSENTSLSDEVARAGGTLAGATANALGKAPAVVKKFMSDVGASADAERYSGNVESIVDRFLGDTKISNDDRASLHDFVQGWAKEGMPESSGTNDYFASHFGGRQLGEFKSQISALNERFATKKENAQNPAATSLEPDHIDDALAATLAAHTKYTRNEHSESALQNLSQELRGWIESGFAPDKEGRPTIPFNALATNFKDPSSAVWSAYQTLRRMGTMPEGSEPVVAEVRRQLEEKQNGTQNLAAITKKYIDPDAAARQGISERDYGNVGSAAADWVSSGAGGAPATRVVLENALTSLFGAKKDQYLEELQRHAEETKASAAENTTLKGSKAGGLAEEVEGGGGEAGGNSYGELLNITKNPHTPVEVNPDVSYHFMNERTKSPYNSAYKEQTNDMLTHAEKLLRDAENNDQTVHVSRRGIVDALREIHDGDPDALSDALANLRALHPDKSLSELNKMLGVLRVEKSDRAERLAVPGTEFSSVSPGEKNNKWAVSVGEKKQHADETHIFLQKNNGEGKSPTEFATTTAKLVAHARKDRAEGGGMYEEGAKGLRQDLLSGLAAVLDSRHTDGTSALLPKVGVSDGKGGVRWLKPGEDLPSSVALKEDNRKIPLWKGAAKERLEAKMTELAPRVEAATKKAESAGHPELSEYLKNASREKVRGEEGEGKLTHNEQQMRLFEVETALRYLDGTPAHELLPLFSGGKIRKYYDLASKLSTRIFARSSREGAGNYRPPLIVEVNKAVRAQAEQKALSLAGFKNHGQDVRNIRDSINNLKSQIAAHVEARKTDGENGGHVSEINRLQREVTKQEALAKKASIELSKGPQEPKAGASDAERIAYKQAVDRQQKRADEYATLARAQGREDIATRIEAARKNGPGELHAALMGAELSEYIEKWRTTEKLLKDADAHIDKLLDQGYPKEARLLEDAADKARAADKTEKDEAHKKLDRMLTDSENMLDGLGREPHDYIEKMDERGGAREEAAWATPLDAVRGPVPKRGSRGEEAVAIGGDGRMLTGNQTMRRSGRVTTIKPDAEGKLQASLSTEGMTAKDKEAVRALFDQTRGKTRESILSGIRSLSDTALDYFVRLQGSRLESTKLDPELRNFIRKELDAARAEIARRLEPKEGKEAPAGALAENARSTAEQVHGGTKLQRNVVANALMKLPSQLKAFIKGVQLVGKDELPRTAARASQDGSNIVRMRTDALTRPVTWGDYKGVTNTVIRLAHEAAHHMDIATEGRIYSGNMKKTFGAAKAAWEKAPEDSLLRNWLDVVFDKKYYGEEGEVKQRRELFSQLVAMHAIEPGTLSRDLPEGAKWVERALAHADENNLAAKPEAAKPEAAKPEAAKPMSEEKKLNAQHETKENTEPVKESDADIAKLVHDRVGDKVKVEIVDTLGDHSAEWVRNAADTTIRIARNAVGGMHTNAMHESWHEFFSNVLKDSASSAAKQMKKFAGNEILLRSLQRILAEHPEALKSLKDPEERLAYAYQFWEAGHPLLRLGKPAEGLFARIGRMVRHITGFMRDDEKLDHIFRKFDKGEFAQDPSAAGKVLDKLNRGPLRVKAVVKAMEPLIRVATDWTGMAKSNLTNSSIPALQRLGQKYTDPQHGVLARTEQMTNKMLAKFRDAIGAAEKDDLSAAGEGLFTGKLSSDPTIRGVQERSLALIEHIQGEYMKKVGLEPQEKGLPMMFSTEELYNRGPEFVSRLVKAHEAELNKIAEGGSKVDGSPLSAKEIADAVYQRLVNEYGSTAERPNMRALDNDPATKALGSQSLSWIDKKEFSDYAEKNLAHVMTSYIRQSVRRTERTRAFGGKGESPEDLLNAAHETYIDRHIGEKYEVDNATTEAKKIVAASGDKKTLGEALAEVVNRDGEGDGLSVNDAEKIVTSSREKLSGAERAIDAMDGTLGYGLHPTIRKAQGYLLAYENIRMLPMALFSNLIDPLGMLIRGGTMDDTFSAYKRGLQGVINTWRGKEKKDNLEHMMETIGVLDMNGFASAMGAMTQGAYIDGNARKINDALFRYNGMETLNRQMRTAAGAAAIKFIIRHATQPNEHSTRLLGELKLDSKYVKSKLNDSEFGLDMHDEKIQRAVNQWVNEAVLRPTAATRPSRMSDPHWALVSMYKGFMYATYNQIIKRAAQEVGYGNYNPLSVLALGYVPVMYASDMAKLIVQNSLAGNAEMPGWWQGMSSKDHAGYAVQRAGLLGPLQVAADMKEYGPSAGLGPVFEQIADSVKDPLGETATKAMPWYQFFSAAQRSVTD